VSGYFGVARMDGKPADERVLEQIAKRLRLSGPHGTSIWWKDGIGSSFALLRTNSGRQSEQQPVVLAERFFLWGDVRLDARTELRVQLGDASPGQDSPETGEQLLLRAWEKWGEEALERILGDFSFALWDARDGCLVCARDFVGARPLYYAHLGNVLYFGNTLRVLLDVPEISRELDELFIADFLTKGFCDDWDRTAFRDVKRLVPGHLLRFSSNGIQVRRFRKLAIEEPLELAREQEYVDGYLEVLREAVRDRLPQGQAAVYLSGGLDSGSVCAIVAEIAGQRGWKNTLKAFTLGWQPFFDDPEPEFASLSAAHLSLNHEVLTDAELVPFAGADSGEWQVPEPDQEYFFLRHKRQLEKIAAFSTVVIGGDGGDDVLAGQSWPYLVHLWRERDWKRIAEDFGGYLWRHREFPPLRAGLRAKLAEMLHPRDKLAGYPRWLNTDFAAKLNLKERWCRSDNLGRADEHPLHSQAYRVLHQGLWGSVLETEDAGWTGVPLETRSPLLDLRVLRFMLRLPSVPWCVHKELARRAMKTRLPEAVLRRPKTPLQKDPLEHCSLPPGWPQKLSNEARKHVERFVNWEKWCETLREPEGSLSWRSLRPISLLFWLKAVEFRIGFQ